MNRRQLIGFGGATVAAVVFIAVWIVGDDRGPTPSLVDDDLVHSVVGKGGRYPQSNPEVGQLERQVLPALAEGADVSDQQARQSGLLAVKDLPPDLGPKVVIAIRGCNRARKHFGIEWPRGDLRMTLESARRLVVAEDALQAELRASGVAMQNVLIARMESDPRVGIRVKNKNKTTESMEARLRDSYPGWPDGYIYTSLATGLETHIAAWKVKGDPELEAIVRDDTSLRCEYARAIRAAYLNEFVFE